MSQSLRAAAWISLACAIFLTHHTTCAARLKPQLAGMIPSEDVQHSEEEPSEDQKFTIIKDVQHSDDEPSEDQNFTIWIQADKNHQVAVTDSTTLGDLKRKITFLTKWPLHHQKVIFQNKQLEDNNATMRDIGVEKESQLRLTAGLLGGLFNGDMRDEWERYDFIGRLVHKTPDASGDITHGTCSALVQGKFALTAAHCFSAAKGGQPQLDKWRLYTTDGKRRLVSGLIHKHYNPVDDSFDVAFVELNKAYDASPVVLDTTPIPPAQKVKIGGFGLDETRKPGNFAVGQFTTLPCLAQHMHLPIACAHSTDASPTSTCGGDSGGPWWRKRKFKGKHRVFGVQSFGYDGGCGDRTKKSGIALLSAAKDWLSEYTPFEWYQDPAVNFSARGSSSTAPQVMVHQSSAPRSHPASRSTAHMQPSSVLPTPQIAHGWNIVDPRLPANRPVRHNVWSASGL